MTRVFPRRRRPYIVALWCVAGLSLVVAVLLWWRPQLGWDGTEQAGWIAGIVGAVISAAALVMTYVQGRSKQPRPVSADSVIQIGKVPLQAAWFQDRRTLIDLAAAARAGRTAVLTQVLSGMGGVGKTQLAAQFARDLTTAGEIDVLVWITAASREAIITGYAEAARALHLADSDIEPESAAGRFLGWMERPDRRWLVVLDNLDSPGDAAGWWPPANPNGRSVITTRRRDPSLAAGGRTMVNVDLFTPDEAIDYLLRATGSGPTQRYDATALAGDLGHLPLAVAHAAAYIRERDLDIRTYRQRFNDRRRPLASVMPDREGLSDDYRDTVAATWSLSIEAADALAPRETARPLLAIAALLDPNGIPADVMTSRAVVDHLANVTGRPVTTDEAADAVHNLQRFSLITHDRQTGVIRMHALVQRAARDQLTDDSRAAAARVAANSLVEIWPKINRDLDVVQTLTANTDALHENDGHALLDPDAHPVRYRAASSLGEVGQLTIAIDAYQRLLKDCRLAFGPDHRDTLAARGHLARWQGEAGDPAGAANAFEQLLTDRTRVLGPDHPDTLNTRGNLAYWRGEAGDPAGAANAFEHLLTDRMRVFGPDHPATLTTRGNVADWRGEAGDPARAATASEQLLTDQMRVLGPDHPATLTTRGNLAHWQGKAGNPDGAAIAFELLLNDVLRVLGPDHPATLTARGNLAHWQGKAGNPDGAANALEQLLNDVLRVLGPAHPETLTTRNNLAYWRRIARDS